MQRWVREPGIGSIRTHPVALSDKSGEGILEVPGDDSVNRALASIALNSNGLGSRYPVEIHRLVEFIPASKVVGVMKIDVEGGE